MFLDFYMLGNVNGEKIQFTTGGDCHCVSWQVPKSSHEGDIMIMIMVSIIIIMIIVIIILILIIFVPAMTLVHYVL